MKREIKFNAWDGMRMLKNVGVHPHMIKSLVKIPNCENQDSDCEYKKGEEGSVIVCQKFDAYTLLQYTGLKDKNGKEIYEGDIVKGEQNQHMTIGWNARFASFSLKRKGWMFDHYFGEAIEENDAEVIGNVYENPELINQLLCTEFTPPPAR